MAGKVDKQRPEDLAFDPNSKLMELIPGCDDVAVRIDPRAGDEEEHGQSDILSEDDEGGVKEMKQRKRRKPKAKRHEYMFSEPKAPKLRPAGDILKGIQWDPTFRSEDFVIGYLERFEGIKELSFDLWLRESTEEDFVPQHRIKYFKMHGNEEIVWSRDDRIDKIFGSGLGDGRLDDE